MDLAISISPLVTREFTAVVLAGFGAELLPLTNDHGDDPCPKALLPVANKAIVDYVLAWIESSGIKDVVLICPAIHRNAISNHIHSDITHALRIDLQTFDETMDSSVGTCTLLRHFSNRIQNDFVVVPCDFLPPPSLTLTSILDKFRADTVSDGSIATTCWFSNSPTTEKGSLPEEWSTPLPHSAIVWDEKNGTLLHVDTPDDTDLNTEELELRMSLMRLYPRTKMSSRYQDSHVYVCRRSVLDLLQEKPHFDSFREEFIPWLCKVPFQRRRREKYSSILNPTTNAPTQITALQHSVMLTDVPVVGGEESSDEESSTTATLRVGVVIHRNINAARINTLPTYFDMSRQLLAALPLPATSSSLISQALVDPSTQIGERTTIKKSVVGRHCVIGKMAKITGCVLLDHCVVEDGAKLDGCILGKNTKVGAKAQLSRCVTQAGYEVSEGDSVKNEKLELSDWTGALDDENSDETDESEE
ncbi:nucleotide-diphospho-sugar transferase [Hymenopellis radicata]|nr:nucleotide-diphospho-sugar transferase [Hymenopellis radicata]